MTYISSLLNEIQNEHYNNRRMDIQPICFANTTDTHHAKSQSLVGTDPRCQSVICTAYQKKCTYTSFFKYLYMQAGIIF